MIKIVLVVYSMGFIRSTGIERAFQQNVRFMAVAGELAHSDAHTAKICARTDAFQHSVTRVVGGGRYATSLGCVLSESSTGTLVVLYRKTINTEGFAAARQTIDLP